MHFDVVHTHCQTLLPPIPFATPLTPVPHLHIPIHILQLSLLRLPLLALASAPLALAPVCFLAAATALPATAGIACTVEGAVLCSNKASRQCVAWCVNENAGHCVQLALRVNRLGEWQQIVI